MNWTSRSGMLCDWHMLMHVFILHIRRSSLDCQPFHHCQEGAQLGKCLRPEVQGGRRVSDKNHYSLARMLRYSGKIHAQGWNSPVKDEPRWMGVGEERVSILGPIARWRPSSNSLQHYPRRVPEKVAYAFSEGKAARPSLQIHRRRPYTRLPDLDESLGLPREGLKGYIGLDVGLSKRCRGLKHPRHCANAKWLRGA